MSAIHNIRLPLAAALLAIGVASHANAAVALIASVRGDACRSDDIVTVRLEARGALEPIGSYAVRCWIDPRRVEYVPNSLRDAGLGAAPALNDLGCELRIAGFSAAATQHDGGLFELDLRIKMPRGDEPLLLIEGFGADALVATDYSNPPYWFDLTALTRPCGTAGAAPTPPPATPPPAQDQNEAPADAPLAPATPTAGARFIDSDVNQDCRTDVMDVAALLDALAQHAPNARADVNADGSVSSADLAAVLERIGQQRENCHAPQHTADAEPVGVYVYQTQPDDNGVFDVVVEALERYPLRAYQLTLTFDPQQTTLLDSACGEALDIDGDGGVVSTLREDGDTLHAAAARIEPGAVPAGEVLARLTFRADNNNPAPVRLTAVVMLGDAPLPLPAMIN